MSFIDDEAIRTLREVRSKRSEMMRLDLIPEQMKPLVFQYVSDVIAHSYMFAQAQNDHVFK